MAGLVQSNMDEGRGMAVIRRVSVDECDLSTIKGGGSLAGLGKSGNCNKNQKKGPDYRTIRKYFSFTDQQAGDFYQRDRDQQVRLN